MLQATKMSLEYCSQNFSPYPLKHLRIVEFPRYRSFAQSFSGVIPYSEAIGFITKLDNSKKIDYVFYTIAHEVAHQWWAHQVISANVQGATMLSESLAQYSALMVQEKEFGEKSIHKFLRYEKDIYLSSRAREKGKEQPLMLNENQPYIHYNKGALAFYTLKSYLGEKNLNQILSAYLNKVAFQSAPFTQSIELVNFIKQNTENKYHYLISDLFEKITFYENSIESAKFKKLDKQFHLTISSLNSKIHSDGQASEITVKMDDLIEVEVYDVNGHTIHRAMHPFKDGKNAIHVLTDKQPYEVCLDPGNLLMTKGENHSVLCKQI